MDSTESNKSGVRSDDLAKTFHKIRRNSNAQSLCLARCRVDSHTCQKIDAATWVSDAVKPLLNL